MRGYISVAFGCPYQGAVALRRCKTSPGASSTWGAGGLPGRHHRGGDPQPVPQVARPLLEEFGAQRVALHLHDTRGTALANAFAGLLLGVTTFDSAAGPGGCPYAPAAGNSCHRGPPLSAAGDGDRDGVDLEAVARASRALSAVLGRSLRSRYLESTTPFRNSPEMC